MAINQSIQNLIGSNRQLSPTDIRNMFFYYYSRTPTDADVKFWENKPSGQLAGALERGARLNKDKSEFQEAGFFKDVVQEEQRAAPSVTEPEDVVEPTIPGATPGFTQEEFPTWEEVTQGIDLSKIPKNDLEFARFSYEIATDKDKERARQMLTALTRATQIAEPIFKQQINIATEYLRNTLAGDQLSFESQEIDLQQKIQDITEDLEFNRDQLTLEQQADLAREKRRHENQLTQTVQNLAARGFGQSTMAIKARQQVEAEHQDIVESSQRKFDRALRSEETQAERGIRGAGLGVERLGAARDIRLGGQALRAEELFGTELFPSQQFPGITPLGGAEGSLRQQFRGDIQGFTKDLLSFS